MLTFLSRPLRTGLSCLVVLAMVLWQHSPSYAQAAAPAPAAPAAPRTAQPVVQLSYVLGYGDTLNVGVVGNEPLRIEDQPIRPDGRISLPLIGEVKAGGLTVSQLSESITKAYTKFFVDPKVVVNVAKFRPLTISVIGWVGKPGSFPIAEPIRLLPALGLAGGLDDRANPTNVLVLRAAGDREVINLVDVFEGRVDDNIILYDGDTVRVEEMGTPDWYRLLPPIASSLSILSTIIILLTRR